MTFIKFYLNISIKLEKFDSILADKILNFNNVPCNDVTDKMIMVLNHDYEILAYSFNKRTCGGEVGDQSLMFEWVMKKKPEEILNFPIDQLEAIYPQDSFEDRFLFLKHYKAICAIIAVLVGYESGSLQDLCVINSINYGEELIELEADIKVEMDPGKITSCSSTGGGCGSGGCGSGGCGSSSKGNSIRISQSQSSNRLKIIN